MIRLDGRFGRIVEESEATPAQKAIREVNAGIYVFDLGPLFETLQRIPEAGPRRERYLPAVLSLYRRRGLTVETAAGGDADEIRGINSQTELAEVSRIMRQNKNEELMAAGVTIEDPATTYVDDDVSVGPDTVIHAGVTLEGTTTIGARLRALHSASGLSTGAGRRRDGHQLLRITAARMCGRSASTVAHPAAGDESSAKPPRGNFSS